MDEEPIYEDEIYDIEYEMFLLSQEIPELEKNIIPCLTTNISENDDGMTTILFYSRSLNIKKLI